MRSGFLKLIFVTTMMGAGARLSSAETNVIAFKQFHAIVENTCHKCHDKETAKGELDLSPLKTQADYERDPRLLEKLVRFVRDREMPPPGKRPQPSEQDRQKFVDWGRYTLAHIDYSKFPKDPGRVTIHRLSRVEYNNTVRDLLGVTNQPADGGVFTS